MNKTISKKIERASAKYSEYLKACGEVAKEAQKHISWDNDVSCEYYPGDGVCIGIDVMVCPAETFFELAEESKDGMISEEMYRINCI